MMGVISGIAGYLNMARLGSYYAAMGDGIEFMVIAAVVIGGTSMVGAWGLLAFVKAADTRQNASFAVRLNKKGA